MTRWNDNGIHAIPDSEISSVEYIIIYCTGRKINQSNHKTRIVRFYLSACDPSQGGECSIWETAINRRVWTLVRACFNLGGVAVWSSLCTGKINQSNSKTQIVRFYLSACDTSQGRASPASVVGEGY